MPLLIEIVDRIAGKTGSDRRSVMSRVNRLKKEMGIEPEVVALVIAAEEGIDLSDTYDRVDEEMLAKARAARGRTGETDGDTAGVNGEAGR